MTSESAELPRDPVYLLYLGRPLWGALLQQPGEDTAAVLSATNTKMYRGRMRSPAISIAGSTCSAIISSELLCRGTGSYRHSYDLLSPVYSKRGLRPDTCANRTNYRANSGSLFS